MVKGFLSLICIKMNRFRVNLHPALFNVEAERGANAKIEAWQEALQSELNDLKNDVFFQK